MNPLEQRLLTLEKVHPRDLFNFYKGVVNGPPQMAPSHMPFRSAVVAHTPVPVSESYNWEQDTPDTPVVQHESLSGAAGWLGPQLAKGYVEMKALSPAAIAKGVIGGARGLGGALGTFAGGGSVEDAERAYMDEYSRIEQQIGEMLHGITGPPSVMADAFMAAAKPVRDEMVDRGVKDPDAVLTRMFDLFMVKHKIPKAVERPTGVEYTDPQGRTTAFTETIGPSPVTRTASRVADLGVAATGLNIFGPSLQEASDEDLMSLAAGLGGTLAVVGKYNKEGKLIPSKELASLENTFSDVGSKSLMTAFPKGTITLREDWRSAEKLPELLSETGNLGFGQKERLRNANVRFDLDKGFDGKYDPDTNTYHFPKNATEEQVLGVLGHETFHSSADKYQVLPGTSPEAINLEKTHGPESLGWGKKKREEVQREMYQNAEGERYADASNYLDRLYETGAITEAEYLAELKRNPYQLTVPEAEGVISSNMPMSDQPMRPAESMSYGKDRASAPQPIARHQTLSKAATILDDARFVDRQPVGEWIKTPRGKGIPKDEPAVIKVLTDLGSMPVKQRLTKGEVQQMLNSHAPELETVLVDNPQYGLPELFVRDPHEYRPLTEEQRTLKTDLTIEKSQMQNQYDNAIDKLEKFWDEHYKAGGSDTLPEGPEKDMVRKLNMERDQATDRLNEIRVALSEFPEPRYDGHAWAKQKELSSPIGRTRMAERNNPDGTKTLVIDNFQKPTEGSGQRDLMPKEHETRAYDLMTQSVLNYARENGYRDVEWTTGSEQNARWGVNVDTKPGIHWYGAELQKYIEDRLGKISKDDLDDIFGTTNNATIKSVINGWETSDKLEFIKDWGLDKYDVGAPEGDLRPVYDKILPQLMGKYGQGQKVGQGAPEDLANQFGADFDVDPGKMEGAIAEAIGHNDPAISRQAKKFNQEFLETGDLFGDLLVDKPELKNWLARRFYGGSSKYRQAINVEGQKPSPMIYEWAAILGISAKLIEEYLNADDKKKECMERGSGKMAELGALVMGSTGVLRPAVLRGGKVLSAPLGKTHYDAKTPENIKQMKSDKSAGFITPDGQYLDRKQSLEWLKENRPEAYGKLNSVTLRNGLESKDYAHAEGHKGKDDAEAEEFMRRQFGR